MGQKFKARKKIHLIGQNILDCICLLGSPFGIPGIRTLYKGLVLHPRKWIWICFGAAGILCVVLSYILASIELAAGSILLLATMILSTIYNFHINREYVLKYNVMVDSGYFEQQERMREANCQRRDRTYEHDAQAAMDMTLHTEKRIEAAAPVQKPVSRPPVKPTRSKPSPAELQKVNLTPAASVQVPEPVIPKESIKPDPAKGKRKLDL